MLRQNGSQRCVRTSIGPITRSEWPFQNFVRGSMEMSTPQSNGFPKNGDPQALSAATKILFWRAIAEIDGTSIISNVIVPGLSRYIILVDDRKRADRLSASISGRSEERRVGKEGVRTCRSRWAPED